MANLKSPGQQLAGVCCVRGRQGHRLAVRFGANATLRFDPKTVQFTVYKSTSRNARAPDSRPARRGVVAGVGGG